MHTPSLQSWLSEGPFTLALSSSFFGFYSHCAVTTVLWERGFRPNKITGTSAGSLVGGALASGMSPDDFRKLIFSKTLQDYWDPKIGFGVLAGQKFLNILKTHFSPSFEKAHLPLEVGVLDIRSLKTRFLTSGSLPEAVFASCAVPLMFHPIKIENRFYLDGGVFNKAGINYESTGERVLNIFLESNGITGIYERKSSFRRLQHCHRVLRFPQTPYVSFKNLKTGVDAYNEIYKRTQLAFDRPFADQIVRA